MPKRDEKRDAPAAEPEQKRADDDERAEVGDDEIAELPREAEGDGTGKTAGADGGERDPDGDGEGAIALLDPDEAAARIGAGRRAGLSTVRDGVGRFLAEAKRYKRLSEQEERALGVAARERGDLNAARTLVVHNLRLVISIAYQYRRAWANILDLFQEGSVGLMEAVKRWEPKLGPRFGTYAAYWIRAYVLRFLMTNSRLIHVGNTRAGRKLFFRLEKERQKLIAAGIDVTPKLLAAKLDVDEKDLNEVRAHLESREVPFDPRPGTRPATRMLPAVRDALSGGGESPEDRGGARRARQHHAEAGGRLPRRAEGRPRARGLARAPGRRGSGGAGRAGRALRRLQAAHGPDRRPAQEALPRRDRREARARRPHRLARRGIGLTAHRARLLILLTPPRALVRLAPYGTA